MPENNVESEVRRGSLRTLHAGLNDACRWLNERGIPMAGGRFAAQRDLALAMVGAYEAHGEQAWMTAFPERASRDRALDLMAEAIETDRIWGSLVEEPDAIPLHILRRWASGPVDLADETASGGETHGRDTAFELVWWAMMREAGLSPRYEEPDIVVQTAERVCLIACKRPRKHPSVGRQFRKACSQIKDHLHRYAGQRPFGIIMVSLSKLYDHVPADLATTRDFEQGWSHLDDFASRYARLWTGLRFPLSDVLMHLLRPAFDRSQQMLVQRQYLKGIRLPYVRPSGVAASKYLQERIEALATVTR